MFFYEEKKNYYFYLSSSSSSSSLNKYRGNQTSARQKGRSFGSRTRWFRIFDVVCFSFLRSSFPLAVVIKSEHPFKMRPSLRHFWNLKTKCVTRESASRTPWKTRRRVTARRRSTRTPPPPSAPSSSRKWPRFWSGSKPTGRKRGRRRRKQWHGSISTDSSPRITRSFLPGRGRGCFRCTDCSHHR